MEEERRLSPEDDTVFELGILENFEEIVTQLERSPEAIVQYEASGLVIDTSEVPSELQPFLGATPQNLTFDINFDPSSNTYSTTIEPIDFAPVTFSSTNGFGTVEHGDNLYLAPSSSIVHDATLLAIPAAYRSLRPDLGQLGDCIVELSPKSHRRYVFSECNSENDADYRIAAQRLETADDSVRVLEVFHISSHPSGHEIGTHLWLKESIKQTGTNTALRINVVNPNNMSEESPLVDINFDNKQFEPPRISKLHMGNILETLNALDQSVR